MIRYNIKELLARKCFEEGVSITLADVAKEVGISRNTIYRMANSKGKFSTRTEYIAALCRYFKCTPNDLMTIVPDPPEDDEAGGKEEGQGQNEKIPRRRKATGG
jgi:putative transcriptional regulator